MSSTLNGNTAHTVIVDDAYDYDINDYSEEGDRDAEDRLALRAGFYEAPTKPINIPTYRTFRSALVNTSAIQTISRRG